MMTIYTKTISPISGRMIIRKYPSLEAAIECDPKGKRAFIKEENVRRCADRLSKLPSRGMYNAVSAPIDEPDEDKLREWMRENFVAMGRFVQERKEFLA